MMLSVLGLVVVGLNLPPVNKKKAFEIEHLQCMFLFISLDDILAFCAASCSNMFFVVLRLLIGASVLNRVPANFQQSGLYRGQKQKIFFGNFKPDKGYKLSTTKISSPLVTDLFDCTFNCITDSRCNSLNFAVNQDFNKLHVCELLETDKYRAAADDLQANGGFLHYSPWVNIIVKGA